jgi:hypothetical protein
MARYYPDQTTILQMTTIRRERLLPPDVLGEVVVAENERVQPVDIVARGVRTAQYAILDLSAFADPDDPAVLRDRLKVELGQQVRAGDVLIAEGARGRTVVRSPATGYAAQLVDNRLVIRAGTSEITIRAQVRGVVSRLMGNRGVLLETTGGLVQAAWGNGKFQLGMLKMEPSGGLSKLEIDEFANEWRGALVVTRDPLTKLALAKADAQGLGGVIAPSMPTDLRKIALKLKIPIMLTEGFGSERMSRIAFNVLDSYTGRQASLNARLPDRWQPDRPEVIIPALAEEKAAAPARNEPLREGSEVRIIRPPHAGIVGKVRALPEATRLLENGLRSSVAEVTLPSGRTVTVPLVNLELFGRG